jgi:AAA family ATP:ADP antiporter
MLTDHSGLSPIERLMALLTRVRPGEGRSTVLFFLQAFLLLFSYYIVKTLREAFILTEFSAEVRAYAVAVIALVLMVLIPIYSAVRRRLDGQQLLRAVTWFFAANMLLFAGAAAAGISIGFTFFVWVSIYGVMIAAQFWAFAADTYNLKSGQRLFPLIMIGGNLGALAGGKGAQLAVAAFSPIGLMLLATALLLVTLAISGPARSGVPEGSRALMAERSHRPPPRLLGGIALVMRDRYLLLIAILVVLLNWINSTGEFILADVVSRNADAQIASGESMLDKGSLITAFYGDYTFWYTLVGLIIQIFLVARIYRWVGVRGALLIHPFIVAIGYGLIVFVPIFSLIRIVKIGENAVDYTLMNTTRHALFLPVDRDAKYEGKTAIDTFFWRFGDLIQAGVVYIGQNVAGWPVSHFAVVNLFVALVWFVLAGAIGREFSRMARQNVINVPPEPGKPIPDLTCEPGQPFRHFIAEDAFRDADPGDVLNLTARLADGNPLPRWMQFDSRRRAFTGVLPEEVTEEITIMVIASDVDGSEASSCFVMRRVVRKNT